MSLSVHIKKKTGKFELNVDLEHKDGITGLLGASGAGKSMTLKCIAGIMKPDEGRIILNGRILFDSEKHINLKPQERNVGYLFQNYALFPNMTVEQNIICGLCKEKNKKRKAEKSEEMMKIMNLLACRNHYPHQLSGGQQQRTALARILVSEPELLLLDEPFSALDSYLREQLQKQIHDILEKFGKETILVSHDREEVYYLCDRTAIMKQGKILHYQDTAELFAHPMGKTAAVLTGCKNIVDAKKTGEYEVYIPDWEIHLRTSEKVLANIKAVGIHARHFDHSEGENSYPVEIVSVREEPFEIQIMFRYMNQKKNTVDLYWKKAKEDVVSIQELKEKQQFLGINPEKIMILYDEEQEA